MKKANVILYAAAFLTLCASCSNRQQFTINGTFGDSQWDGHKAYLLNATGIVDSADITEGRFTFSGTVAEPWIGTVAAESDGVRAQLDCIVEPGTINIDIVNDALAGTPLNDSLQLFLQANDNSDLESELNAYLQLYYMAPDVVSRAEAERCYDSLEAIAIDRTYRLANDLYSRHHTDLLGAYAMGVLCGTDRLDYAALEQLLADAAPTVRNYPPVDSKLTQLRAVDATSAGRHYTDIQGVDGRLSDLIDGRLALVDFYASWCGPCRAEIRDNLVPLWKKYQDKGLVIVGLNVWERGDRATREAAHQKVMADLGITYPQLVDSTRTATDTYGVRGIPQIMLIGPDGTILARDLRGAAIEEAIVKALGK